MCGRYSIKADPGRIGDRFGVLFDESLTGRFDVRPSQQVPVVFISDDRRCGEGIRWGLVPSWSKDERIGHKMINARAETLLEKRSFKPLVSTAKNRCLIVADGFYEWMKPEDPKQKKTPMYFGLDGNEPFSFAGLWTTWTSARGETVASCTIITTVANALVAKVHDRMPVIFSEPSSEEVWLDSNVSGEEATNLLEPADSSLMYTRVADELLNRSSGK